MPSSMKRSSATPRKRMPSPSRRRSTPTAPSSPTPTPPWRPTRIVSIGRTEIAFDSAFIAAEVDSQAADKAATAKDLTAASIDYQKAVNDLDQCKVLSADSDIAPQFLPVVVAYGKLMTDVAGLADTERANDLLGAIGYLHRLIQHSTVITFDQQAYLTWYSQKFDPLERAFRHNAVAVPRYTVTTTTLV